MTRVLQWTIVLLPTPCNAVSKVQNREYLQSLTHHHQWLVVGVCEVWMCKTVAKQKLNTGEGVVISLLSISIKTSSAVHSLLSLNPMTLKKSDQQPTTTAAELLCWQKWRGCMVRSDLKYQTIPGINESPAPTQVSSWHSGQWSEQMLVTRM